MILKIFICILGAGAIFRLPIQEEHKGYRDFIGSLFILINIFIPRGNVYGLTVITVMCAYFILNTFLNIRYPILRDAKIDELQDELSKFQMAYVSAQHQLKEQEDELVDLRVYKRDTSQRVHTAVDLIYHWETNKGEITDEALISILDTLVKNYKKPIVVKEGLPLDMFNNLVNNRQRKKAIKTLQTIRKENNIGDGFDKTLKRCIEYLEEVTRNAAN